MSAPRIGASDPYERIRAELIQIGNSRWSATHDGKLGVKIWVGERPIFAVIAGIEDSRVSKEDPVPFWQKCVTALLERMNAPSPLSQAEHAALLRLLDWACNGPDVDEGGTGDTETLRSLRSKLLRKDIP